jgi:hypothetical protein
MRVRVGAGLGWALLCCVLWAGPGAAAETDIAAAALPARASALTAKLAGGQRGAALSAAGEELGTLVDRARAVKAGAPVFEQLLAAASALERAIDAERERLEEATGEREDALEALYGSEAWRRLDYANVLRRYWSGWAELSGAAFREGSRRRDAFARAERAFSRTALEVSLPRVATMSLLGAAIARRELGQTQRARRALIQFEAQVERSGDVALLGPALLEATRLALDEGDLARAEALFARVPEDGVTREQRLGFEQLRAEALLKAARGGATGSAERAAGALRTLLDAGPPYSEGAVALAVEYKELLLSAGAGDSLGALGAWLAAEEAFGAERYAEARDRYAPLLAAAAPPGLDVQVARYKYAAAISQAGGDRGAALEALDALIASGSQRSLHKPAARMAFGLAAREYEAHPNRANEQRLARMSRRLLTIAPGAPEADQARLLAARSDGGKQSLALLDAVSAGSAAYPGALAERIRQRGEALQARENRGRSPSAAEAKRLVADIDSYVRLVGDGVVAADAARDRQLQVLGAKASRWSGATISKVQRRVAAARATRPNDAQRRSLLRVELAALADARRFAEVLVLFRDATDAEIRRDYAVWNEATARLVKKRLPAGDREVVWRRLARLAPKQNRAGARLEWARALLASGDAEAAVAETDALLEAEPEWGDPALLRARALARLGDHAETQRAWRAVSDGVEPGTELWADAEFEYAAAARRAGDDEAACGSIRRLTADEWTQAPWIGRVSRRLDELSLTCGDPGPS